ncbi:kinase-like protein [Hymenopellis radicata]|nr:kinase-like protein [Hymenopellis radicata]
MTNEEAASLYERRGYHPVSIGDTYNSRYTVLRQLGWGQYSTVWLVRDTQDVNLASMKILVADLTNDAPPGIDELGMLKTAQSGNPLSPGYPHICHLLDNFSHHGPNGEHICLIQEAMTFNFLEIYNAFRFHPTIKRPMPFFMAQRVAQQVLLALQYMHDECGLVHTDIKGDNILMSGEVEQLGEPNVELEMTELCFSTYKLSDFGSANKVSNRFAGLIQPIALRSPEVIIGAEWDTKADIWNFACLIHEFCSGDVLFNPMWNHKEESGLNPTEMHLAQIVTLFGAFPRTFLDQGKLTSRYFDADGHLLKAGPSFTIRHEDLLRGKQLPEELPLFLDFLSKGLIIDPSQRWSATQLLAHPWLVSMKFP